MSGAGVVKNMDPHTGPAVVVVVVAVAIAVVGQQIKPAGLLPQTWVGNSSSPSPPLNEDATRWPCLWRKRTRRKKIWLFLDASESDMLMLGAGVGLGWCSRGYEDWIGRIRILDQLWWYIAAANAVGHSDRGLSKNGPVCFRGVGLATAVVSPPARRGCHPMALPPVEADHEEEDLVVSRGGGGGGGGGVDGVAAEAVVLAAEKEKDQ
ncbi:hypothetical protein M378DRAFT_17653 [Amanita muscaria Koide BX008]|uniref:Uncharacterized protein n=1 Tax=Amanita muscaria (strain Koide BX008) TaxID=946122 RepID=A0A0C2WGK0_AMAMK|nr:hypothetical protein M378DRAFT_17653 [Amanita muscaria Koide BX008]